MDFDDVLLNMNILLRDSPAACAEISGMFDYILVDEYQDTNMAQYIILKRLAAVHHNLCVVGDDSQSIYGFRGARVENILNFRKDYPEARIFRLEQNYRSTQTIVNAANSVIEKNSSRIPKTCFSKGDEGEKIKLIKAFTETEEAMLTVSAILGIIRSESAQYQDFAILYRTNAQSRALEEALRKRNVPYKIFSGNSFYERAEIRDAMAYLKLTVNINDDESFRRIINKPARGIGDTSVVALTAAAHGHGTTLFKAAYEADLETYGLKPAAAARIRGFCDFIAKLSVRAASEDAYTIADEVLKGSGLWQSLKADTSVEGQSRFANLEELLNAVKLFIEDRNGEYVEDQIAEERISSADELKAEDYPLVRLSDYLENVSLISAADVSDEESANRVALMTVHTSKGLEFPYVFIAGMEENLFPSGGWLAPENEIEEERRLFYVAVTRAEKRVSMSFAKTRMRHGKSESNAPSRFLYEIDSQYILNPISKDEEEEGGLGGGISSGVSGFGGRFSSERVSSGRFSSGGVSGGRNGHGRPQQAPSQAANPARRPEGIASSRPLTPSADFVPSPVSDLRAGQRIEHNRFGAGTIKQLSGTAPDVKAVISFDNFGEKILLLKYAKVRILE